MASPTIGDVTFASGTGSGSNPTISRPTSTATADYVVVQGIVQTTSSTPPTTMTDMTLLDSASFDIGGGSWVHHVAWAGTAVGATLTWTVSYSAGYSLRAARVIDTDGVDATAALEVSFSGTSHPSPEVTTTVDDCLVVQLCGTFDPTHTMTTPSGWTLAESDTAGSAASYAWTKVQATAGATGTATSTSSTSAGTLRVAVAFAPAATGDATATPAVVTATVSVPSPPLVGAFEITYPITGVSATFSATRSPAFTLGTSPQEDDILVAFISSTTTATVADISEWTNVLGSATDVESDAHQSFMVYHRVTAAEDAANTVTWTLTNIYGATETGRISVAVLRGVKATSELVGSASGSDVNLVDGTIPSVTPTADSVVIAGLSQDGTGTRTSAPTGYTDIAGGTSTQHNYIYRRTSNATSGSPTGTAAANTGTNDEYVSIVAAFEARSSGVTNATVTPAVVTATASVPSPSVSTGVSIAASVVAAVCSVLAPAVSTGSDANITPAVVTATASVPAPTVGAGAGVTPAAVTATTSVPSPTVTVTNPASVPRNVRPADAFGYDSEVLLDWDTPTSDGGGTITGYRIRRSTDDGGSWTTHTADTGSATTSATLTGLSNGTRYVFEVAAINAAGIGATAVSEWGCTPVADAAPQTPPTPTAQTSAPWHLARIDQTALPLGTTYNYSYTGAGVRVYIVDTGIRATHDEFDNITVTSGYSVAATSATNDVFGHGTALASTVAGATFGVAKGVTIVPVKVFEDDHTPGDVIPVAANLLDCLDWVATNHPGGPAVVLMTCALGPAGSSDEDAAAAAIAAMIADGFVFSIAILNESGLPDLYTTPPQPGQVLVAGCSDDDSLWSGSTLGPTADLFAPADTVEIAAISSDSATSTASGTSFAAPCVAGAMALWLEANPDLTPRQLQDLVRASSTKDVVTGTLLGTPNRLLYTLADIPPAVVDATATPAVVTATASVLAPTVTAASNATVTPAVVTAAASIPAPTVSAASNATATPGVVTAVASVPAPSVSAGGSATVTPTAITATVSVPAPTVTAASNATATPAVVTATTTVPTATVTTASNATVAPAVVTATVGIPSPTIAATASATATPGVVTATASVPAPFVEAGTTSVAGYVAASVDAPSIVATVDAPSVTATVAAPTITATVERNA